MTSYENPLVHTYAEVLKLFGAAMDSSLTLKLYIMI